MSTLLNLASCLAVLDEAVAIETNNVVLSYMIACIARVCVQACPRFRFTAHQTSGENERRTIWSDNHKTVDSWTTRESARDLVVSV